MLLAIQRGARQKRHEHVDQSPDQKKIGKSECRPACSLRPNVKPEDSLLIKAFPSGMVLAYDRSVMC